MAGGYMGRYLVVDLTSGTHEVVAETDAFYRKVIGGYGLGAAVVSQRQRPGIDPLAPDSYLGLCAGLLTGSGVPFSGRFYVRTLELCGRACARSAKAMGVTAVESVSWMHTSNP